MFLWSVFQTSSSLLRPVCHPGLPDNQKKASMTPKVTCSVGVWFFYSTKWRPTSWSGLTSTLSSSSWSLALVKREDSEEEVGRYKIEARTNSSLSRLRSHSVIPGSRLCSRASEAHTEDFYILISRRSLMWELLKLFSPLSSICVSQ